MPGSRAPWRYRAATILVPFAAGKRSQTLRDSAGAPVHAYIPTLKFADKHSLWLTRMLSNSDQNGLAECRCIDRNHPCPMNIRTIGRS